MEEESAGALRYYRFWPGIGDCQCPLRCSAPKVDVEQITPQRLLVRVFAFRSRESKAVLAGFHPYFRQVHDDPLQQFSNKLSILAATFKIVLDLGFSAARSAKKSALAEAYLFEVERTLSSV